MVNALGKAFESLRHMGMVFPLTTPKGIRHMSIPGGDILPAQKCLLLFQQVCVSDRWVIMGLVVLQPSPFSAHSVSGL